MTSAQVTQSTLTSASEDAALLRTRDFWNRYFVAEASHAPQPAGFGLSPERDAVTGKVEWMASGEELEACNAFTQPDGFGALASTDRILILGCGSSHLGAHLYDAGHRHVDSIDISPIVIDQQRRENARARPGMRWMVGSCTDMRGLIDDGAYDAVIDKGTCDTLSFRCAANRSFALIEATLHEVNRVLTPTGAYFCITTRKRMTQLYQPHFDWKVRRINVAINSKARRVHRESAHPSASALEEETAASPLPGKARAYVQICVKHPRATSSATTENATAIVLAYTHNMPKAALEAQQLLAKIREHMVLCAEADRRQQSKRAALIALSRSQLFLACDAALRTHPSLELGTHTPVLVHFAGVVGSQRALSKRLVIFHVQAVEHGSTVSPHEHAASPVAADGADPSGLDLDKIECFMAFEDFTGALADPPVIDDEQRLASFIALHSLIRKTDRVRMTGYVGRGRARQPIVFIREIALIAVGAERLQSLEDKVKPYETVRRFAVVTASVTSTHPSTSVASPPE